MFNFFFNENSRRRKLLKTTQSSVMRSYLQTPFPDKNDYIKDTTITSLDFETTGLDIANDRLVSFGLVDIMNLSINLNLASHQLINPERTLPEKSVVIHQITDQQIEQGLSIREVMPELLKRLTGKVLLAHNATIELGYLNKICNNLYQTDFVIPVIDTQYLAKRSFEIQNKPYKSNDLRLFNLRSKLNMPAYKAHNALMDAIATAELLLAMVPKISSQKTAKLKNFLL